LQDKQPLKRAYPSFAFFPDPDNGMRPYLSCHHGIEPR
jgi:hypothetical protein